MASSWPLLKLLADTGPLAQGVAARRLGLSTGTCNLHCQRLEHAGLVVRAQQRAEGGGRPTILWDLDRTANFCVTLVFDVPYFQAAVHDLAGAVLLERREDLSHVRKQAEVLARVDGFLKAAGEEVARRGGRIRQGFAAFPGIVDRVSGEVRRAANFPVLNGLNLVKLVEASHGYPFYAGHLGLAFYYGETASLPPDDMVMLLYLDLGIGVLFGRGGTIVEMPPPVGPQEQRHPGLGHVKVRRDGLLCHCGQHGCLEAYASGWAMMRDLVFQKNQSLTDLVHRVESGEAQAVRVARKALEFLGASLSWPAQMMGTTRMVLTGPLAPVFSRLSAAFERGLGAVFSPEEVKAFRVTVSRDPQASMRRGACLVARRLFLEPEAFAPVGGNTRRRCRDAPPALPL